MIDAHCHLQDARFADHLEEVISLAKKNGVEKCVVNGTSEDDWKLVADLAHKYPDFVHPSFGLHPWQVEKRTSTWLKTLTFFLAEFPNAAVGEIGLDRWMENPNLEEQHQCFRQQLTLAQELERPASVHCLRAWGPLLEELRVTKKLPSFMLHSFAGSFEVAQECLTFGACFSFSGDFLNPRREKVREVFRQIPSDRILVETDAPDMPPAKPEFELDGLNHPAYLPSIARSLAEICRCSVENFTTNARKFFSL